MSPRKRYKNRLPTVLPPLPPAPRPAPSQESLPPEPRVPQPAEEGPPDDLGRAPGDPDAASTTEADPTTEASGPTAEAAATEADPATRATLLWEVADTPRRSPARAGLVGLLVLLLAGAVGLGAWALGGRGTERADPAPRVPAADARSSEPAPVRPGTSQVRTLVRPDGSVVVRQHLRSLEPVRTLTLTVPDLGDEGDVTARRVRVVADGTLVDGPGRVTVDGADFDLADATDLRVSYRLTGAIRPSGSAPGRALALATSLDTRWVPAPDAETRVVRAPQVLALACSAPAAPEPRPCGTAQGLGEWRVDLDGDRVDDRVVAQLTVPGLGGAA